MAFMVLALDQYLAGDLGVKAALSSGDVTDHSDDEQLVWFRETWPKLVDGGACLPPFGPVLVCLSVPMSFRRPAEMGHWPMGVAPTISPRGPPSAQ